MNINITPITQMVVFGLLDLVHDETWPIILGAMDERARVDRRRSSPARQKDLSGQGLCRHRCAMPVPAPCRSSTRRRFAPMS